MNLAHQEAMPLEHQIGCLVFDEDKDLKSITELLYECKALLVRTEPKAEEFGFVKQMKLDKLILTLVETEIGIMTLGYNNDAETYKKLTVQLTDVALDCGCI